MNDNQIGIVDAAKSLARNPLGIIALFIVLVYGFASLVTAFAGSFTHEERLPLIYFLVFFPVMVLAVFAWLVSTHSGKLFAPADFKNEENYVKMQLSAVASLATAAAKNPSLGSESDIARIVEVVQEAAPQKSASVDGWRNHVLWVDDHPENNVYERQAFEAVGLKFSLALTTDDALAALERQKFAAVISDMGRKEGPREGYVLLDAMRAEGNQTPLFFYASSNTPEHKSETREHDGQGCTNNAQELFHMVTKAVISGGG
ncbi:histidine kinase [Chromobacterium violaceum]|uniref:response regulator n=1 Tax=Chromobacterium violaceum TaxID=536 RepID=UPI000653E980|nr:response regulator [Chromobacterium violaceum]KMN48299.1 histidine kinase [Chromobacterium violaceum]KMN84350.1 histidine kinase [Chromobacterium violaceum]KMN91383.1 histidine kinase [Chromobacterium violaceum]KMO02579.1 histidine kinase [Chromobacterium violaceum]